MRIIKNIATEAWLPLLLVGAWLVASANSESLFFPPLSSILAEFRDTWFSSEFMLHAVPSIRNLVIGFFIAVIVGIVAGTVIGLNEILRDITSPVVEFLRAIPGIAIMPVALVLFGVGPSMKIGVIAFGAVWPILLNTIDGMRSIDPVVKDVAATYRLRASYRLFYLRMPNAAPQIFAGMRTGLAIAVVLVIVSEMLATTEGIGFFTIMAQRQFETTAMWTGMLLLGVIGYVSNILFRIAERKILAWQHAQAVHSGGNS